MRFPYLTQSRLVQHASFRRLLSQSAQWITFDPCRLKAELQTLFQWRRAVRYGERQRPEHRSRGLSVDARVADAPRTVLTFIAAILLALIYGEIRAQTPMIRIITLDESNRPAAAVRLELRRAGAVVGSAVTNEKGEAEFPLPAPGNYEIAAAKEEFETLTQADLTIAAGAPLEVRFVMVPRIKIGEKMDVTASAASATPLEQGASPSTDLQ